MAEIRSPEAKQLCTATELELFKNSLSAMLKKLTPAQLRTKVSRTRRLRDKYRDLAHRQRREARGKQQPRSTRASQGNERTVRKVDLFNQMMDRFQDRLKALEAEAKKTSKSSSTAKKKKKTGSTRKKSAKAKPSPERVRAEKPAAAEKDDYGAVESKKLSRAKKGTKSVMEMLATTPPPRELNKRAARRKSKSRTSDAPSRQDIRESGASKKIKGHVSASTKRAQGRRDAK